MNRKQLIWIAAGVVVMVAVFQLGNLPHNAAHGQADDDQRNAPDKPAAARFEFMVIESVDAKYLGDTASHHGRNGLKGKTPNLSLGDPVYRGKSKVGHVSSILWDKTREALDVEFNPEPFERISVGDEVWVVIDGSEHRRGHD